MRVLCVSHTYVSPWQRAKLALLGSYDDTDLHVLIPPRWRGTLGLAEAAARQATPLQPVPYAMHVQPVLGAGHVRRYVFVPWRVRALLRRLRPQVVYVEAEADSLVLWQFARWRREFDYRLVMFGWENLPRPGIRSEHSWARWMLGRALDRLERWTLARLDVVIWGNAEGAARLRAQGFARALHVLPQLGVDPAVFAPGDRRVARRALGLSEERPLVGFLGRLVRAKGLLTMCCALEGLLRSGVLDLLIVGAGPLKGELAAWIAEHKFERSVHLLPAVPLNDVPRHLRALDALVLPSESTPLWKEQFGHVLIEAMACGVPVVGSDSGAIPEVIGEAGLLFPAGDATALRERVERLLGDGDLQSELAARGRARVEREYTNAVIAGRLHDILLGAA